MQKVKTQSLGSAEKSGAQRGASKARQSGAPRELSKLGKWMRNNPEGIFIIKDRRAVNK